jgi:ADP-ribose pyrophosphatase YjhB (NUDIX family)
MNFCSQCGSGALRFEIPSGDHLPRYICSVCDRIHYQNPKVIVGCVPVWEDRVLIARRGIEPRLGLWNLPAGFLECDETVETGAAREVYEETGAKVKMRRLHTVFNLPHEQQVYLLFLADLIEPVWKLTPESTEIALFSESEVPWEHMAFSSSSFAIERYFSDLKTGNESVHLGSYIRKRV